MVEQVDLDRVFHALSDPTRRVMLGALRGGPMRVGDLAAPHAMSLAAAAKHLQVLERAGLVRREARGRERLCHLEPARLAVAFDWLGAYARFWSDRLDALEALLASEDAPVDPLSVEPR
ncbi:MAG TPA: metalloregulator ArsR/SmtB family transcription factor [Myxococcota bacterium]|nr:metalloregulator ArsR/SmtB family transcription factor [Myxococcota bacterium]